MLHNTVLGKAKFIWFLLIPLLLGVFLLVRPQKNTDVTSFEREHVSINIVQLKQDKLMPFDKIFGSLLVLISVGMFFWLNKPQQAVSPQYKAVELTTQEYKIHDLIKEGYTNKEIATALHVSVSTVKTHINNIFKKKGVSSRKELIG